MDKPWITGPKELLEHGIEHLIIGKDFDLRMAMICIDNAVELSIKTYLGLPKRLNKIEDLSKNKLDQLKESFPKLIDGLETYANNKIRGIELGDIEWFHRLRNELYHDGNGVTVEKQKVEAYKAIAIILFKNLFETEIKIDKREDHSLTGEFISNWADLENTIHLQLGYFKGVKTIKFLLDELRKKRIISIEDFYTIENLMRFRNELIHGRTYPSIEMLNKNIEELKSINNRINEYTCK